MPRRTTPPTPETPLHELWNLSRTTAAWLEELGVKNYGDLCQRDLHQLWLDLKLRHSQVTKLMFYALWGAVHNQHWDRIPESEKEAFEGWRNAL
jgi:hypothetical protein